jgi:3-deoxy-D-manno-octulosonic-acid transferase
MRSFKAPAYRKRWLERLGAFTAPIQKGGIWIHTVSVGEFMAALPFIKELRKQYPEVLITVTTTTPTGSERVVSLLGTLVFHVYLPYDFSFGIKSFLHKIQPKICIILETELWLNLLTCCHHKSIPVCIINGRLSPHSFKRYMLVRYLVKDMLNKITQVMAQSDLDGDRFLQLGLAKEKLSVPGNIKYDISVPEQQVMLGRELKKSWGTRLVWIAASTHDGEEKQILDVFSMVKQQIPGMLLVLVPRHPERFNAVAELIKSYTFTLARRSIQQECSAVTDVFLVDTMGELGIFYQTADVAFVGGSLVPIGGHNMLEPAAAGVPIISGPYLHNFTEISQKMLAANAMVVVNNTKEFAEVLLSWLQSSEIRQSMGTNAKSVVTKNQGATKKILTMINAVFR